jgi:hypothetical protein
MRYKTRLALLVLLFLTAFTPLLSSSRNLPANPPTASSQNEKHDKNSVVYVCACLKTKSCSCMTVAKMEGPCACGPKGGPPLKAVARDSDWAKENLDRLAK